MKNPIRSLFMLLACLSITSTYAQGAYAQDLESPVIDTSDGLVINGERVADKATFDAAIAEGMVNLYTGKGEDTERDQIEHFTRDTGIPVNMTRLVTSRLTERVLSEAGVGRLEADIIRTSDPAGVSAFMEEDILGRYKIDNEATLNLAGQTSEERLYYLSAHTVYGIGYNSARVTDPADAPTSWADLADPKWADQIGLVQVSAGGSTLALARFLLSELGEDWLRGIAALKPQSFDTAAAFTEALARGELTVGPVLANRASVVASNGAPVTYVFPEEGMVTFPWYLSLTNAAPHPNAAKLFINWSMSKRSQDLIPATGDYPARADAGTPVTFDGRALPPMSENYSWSLDDATTYPAIDTETWDSIMDYAPQ